MIKQILILNKRDALTLEYLKKIRSISDIENAIKDIPTGRKIYLTNILKILNVQVPEHIYHECADLPDVQKYLDNIYSKIKVKKKRV